MNVTVNIQDEEVENTLVKLCSLLGITTDAYLSNFVNESTMFMDFLEEQLEEAEEDE